MIGELVSLSWMANILLPLIVSLIIIIQNSINMIEKKTIGVFMPFWILGFGLCLSAGFIFANFYDIAIDIFLVFKFVASLGMLFSVWRVVR
jgi:hypothetical protein